MDGGRTAAALLRTSKAFRQDSASYRFHSVQLHNLEQVKKFLAAYQSALAAGAPGSVPPVDPPHVRHLMLTFLSGKADIIVLGPCFHFMDYHSWS